MSVQSSGMGHGMNGGMNQNQNGGNQNQNQNQNEPIFASDVEHFTMSLTQRFQPNKSTNQSKAGGMNSGDIGLPGGFNLHNNNSQSNESMSIHQNDQTPSTSTIPPQPHYQPQSARSGYASPSKRFMPRVSTAPSKALVMANSMLGHHQAGGSTRPSMNVMSGKSLAIAPGGLNVPNPGQFRANNQSSRASIAPRSMNNMGL